MTTVPGDPASTSVLAGTLRRDAIRLVELEERLRDLSRRTTRQGLTEMTGPERELLLAVAEQLDRIGAMLQTWSTDAAEDSARVRAIAAEAARADLLVDGHHVIETPGPSRVDPASRLATRERLQSLLNRVTARGARSRASLQKELEASVAALARVSEQARLGLN